MEAWDRARTRTQARVLHQDHLHWTRVLAYKHQLTDQESCQQCGLMEGHGFSSQIHSNPSSIFSCTQIKQVAQTFRVLVTSAVRWES